ncbi:MAG: glycosyltransferase family 2 protein [Nitratireductor sp.]
MASSKRNKSEKKPKLIVIFPIYNGERTMQKTLENIANQTFKDFEGIICENQSTDASLKIAKAFCKKDKRFSVHEFEEHAGPIDNFTRSLELVKGKSEYVCIRACDDLSSDNFLEELVSALDQNPSKDVAVCDDWRILNSKVTVMRHRPVILDMPNAIRERRAPSRLYFPSDWFYMMYRNNSAIDVLQVRLKELGTAWCVASYVLADFVLRGKICYTPNAHFECYRGTQSKNIYKPKGFLNQAKARFAYFKGCYKIWKRTDTQDIISRLIIANIAWRDSGYKTGYRIQLFKK